MNKILTYFALRLPYPLFQEWNQEMWIALTEEKK